MTNHPVGPLRLLNDATGHGAHGVGNRVEPVFGHFGPPKWAQSCSKQPIPNRPVASTLQSQCASSCK